MRRRGRGLDARRAGGGELVQLGHGALQRRAVPGPCHHGLDVTQGEQLPEGDLGEPVAQLREPVAGDDGDAEVGRSDGRTVGRREIGLGPHDHNGCPASRNKRIPHPLSRIPRLFAVQHEIRRFQVLPAHLDPQPLDTVVAVAQARRVHQPEWEAVDRGVGLDRIARGARHLGHDRPLPPQQRVEERRLPRVGRARDHEQRAFAQALPLGRRAQQPRHALPGRAPRVSHPLGPHRALVFLGEIDLVGEQRLELEDLAPQRVEPLGEPAVELLQGAPPLRRRPGVDQIRRRLRLQQVHLPVQHGAARELTRFRRPGAGDGERGHRLRRHEQSAVGRELDEIFAGVGVGTWKAHREHLIDGLARGGVVELRAEQAARRVGVERRQAARGDRERAAPRQPDQGEGGAPGGRGEGDDGIGQHPPSPPFARSSSPARGAGASPGSTAAGC